MSDSERTAAEVSVSRRAMLGGVAAVGLAATLGRAEDTAAPLKGRVKQSASRWCFGRIPLDKLCEAAVRIGLKGLDLVGPGDFETLKKHGLVATMVQCGSIGKGLNRVANHAAILADLRRNIEAAAAAGVPNVICFSGNRAGMADDEGLKNCVSGLKQIAGYAEEKQVTVCMELLNSKRDHHDYMCDHTAWGAAMCKQVGSERVKLLYDIYHMQIQEGDVIGTIRQFKDCIGHYHTAGVPGRNEIDDSQELNYPAIMKAIVATGFQGYVAHEFVPKRDALTALAQAVRICDV